MRLFVIIIVCFSFLRIEASPQSPDFLIIEKDTFSIYFLPINHLDTNKQKEFYQNLQCENKILQKSFNLWRGYQAYWQLIDDKLYLVNLRGYNNSDSILKETFPDYYNNGKVLAYWFSSYLAISKDKLLKWDGIFSRTYFKEEVFEFTNGLLTDNKLVDNYVDLKDGISRLDEAKVVKRIFKMIKKMDWKILSECECDDKYVLTIDEFGKISEVQFAKIFDTKEENLIFANEHKSCVDRFKNQLKDMQFDIIKWNGRPYSEEIIIELFYDKKLENWTE